MQPAYIIGIDIGTGSTKAVALNRAGEVLCSAQRFYLSSEKTEQDVHPVFDAFRESINEVVATIKHPPVAVALSSAMHSIMAIDAAGEPLTKAILWSDTRSTEIAQELRQSSLGEKIYLATGTPLHSMSPLCKIKWFQQYEPSLFSKTAKFISIKEAVWHRLFDEYVIDHSLASATGLFNIQQLQWDCTALDFAGISTQQLSSPVPVGYKKEGFQTAFAASINLPPQTPFIIGGSDGCLANLGSLCLTPTEAALTIGTSAAVRITTPRPVQHPEKMIFNYLLDDHTFICGGPINNGGNVFQWVLKNLFSRHQEINTFEQLFSAIATVPPGSDGLLFLPYLHGERAPIWDESSSGVYFGIQSHHTLFHFARAAAEGVCFALYHILSSLEEVCGEVERITISGGLVQSPVMMQLLADVTGKEIVVQQLEDASAIGAVFLAWKALGMIEDFRDIPKKEGTSYLPQADATETYQKLIPVYQELYPLLKTSMHTLHSFTS